MTNQNDHPIVPHSPTGDQVVSDNNQKIRACSLLIPSLLKAAEADRWSGVPNAPVRRLDDVSQVKQDGDHE